KLARLNIQKEKDIYQAKIEFFTNVAHEIKTPLTLIKIPLENLLKKKTLDSKGIAQNLSVMEKNTERLLNLVNELLDFRKTEIEELKLTFVESNISELVRNIHLRFSDFIKEKNITFSLDIGNNDIHAFVDEEAMRKILSNLFNNAIKYSKNRVDVTLVIRDTDFELVIKNDGDLIPSNLKNKIFEPFFRISNTENITGTGTGTGTGIGLSLALALTELHKGTLIVQDSQDLMNVFKLKIPLHQEKEFTMHLDETSKTTNDFKPFENEEVQKNAKPIILVVEDNIELLNFIAMELSQYFTVLKAVNGIEALKVIENTTIHLVISDIAMPLLDGITLCQKIKANEESSHIPVILLSAKDAINTKISGLESGADAYISKPFSMDYVIAQIFNLLSNRKHVMEYFASSPLSYLKYVAHNKTDEDFINKLDVFVFENISNPDLDVKTIAEAMFMSKSTLYRKIKELSNLSPNELINTARLKKATELLLTGKYKIFEIAEMVGFKSQSSFGRNFQKQFNMTPSEYLNKRNKL
ncbi:MAG: response regulator, partial [Flavobacteriales bacterium]|nr:response regulator [Flavobacteriales bacterium]